MPESKEEAAHKDDICATVDPGICGLPCRIRAHKENARTVIINIGQTQCEQINRLSEQINRITLQELFAPLTRNPVCMAAQKAGCHASCPVPSAILKTAEVAMEMALPKQVQIKFENCD
jgi:UDP-N-acetyl-D-mannosaminuronate dehydrogenase